jgi:hypothetical protein
MKAFSAYWPSGQAVRWRTLSWKEFDQFRRLQQANPDSSMKVYLALYRAVVLEGPHSEDVTAGIVDYIGEFCLEQNPFNGRYEDLVSALEIKRASLGYLGHARALVAGLFRYTFEEIDSWDADTFFERLTQAEFLAGRKIDPEDPNPAPIPEKASGKTPPTPPPKKALTAAQQLTLERVRQRT